MLNDKWIVVIVALLAFGIGVFTYFYTSNLNHRQSLERQEFCYEQIREVNLPTTVCSQIALATDGARNAGSPTFFSGFIFLLTICVLLTFRVLRVQSELREIKEKVDV